MDFSVGDIVQMKKSHPCGSAQWEILRTGIDFRIKCCGCVKKCPNEAFCFDDPGFLYHKEELEEMYAGTRREPSLYL